jgi:hypothetical protein
MSRMTTYLRIYSDADGRARFEECEMPLAPPDPALDELGISAPLPALAAFFVRAPAGGGHPEQPEARRMLAVVTSGEVEVIAAGDTRVGRPGDVLLIEDTEGFGHASRTGPGFSAIMIALADTPPPTS